MTDISPCPRHEQHEREPYVLPYTHLGETLYFVKCHDCGHRGDWGRTKDEAIKAWNWEATHGQR